MGMEYLVDEYWEMRKHQKSESGSYPPSEVTAMLMICKRLDDIAAGLDK